MRNFKVLWRLTKTKAGRQAVVLMAVTTLIACGDKACVLDKPFCLDILALDRFLGNIKAFSQFLNVHLCIGCCWTCKVGSLSWHALDESMIVSLQLSQEIADYISQCKLIHHLQKNMTSYTPWEWHYMVSCLSVFTFFGTFWIHFSFNSIL